MAMSVVGDGNVCLGIHSIFNVFCSSARFTFKWRRRESTGNRNSFDCIDHSSGSTSFTLVNGHRVLAGVAICGQSASLYFGLNHAIAPSIYRFRYTQNDRYQLDSRKLWSFIVESFKHPPEGIHCGGIEKSLKFKWSTQRRKITNYLAFVWMQTSTAYSPCPLAHWNKLFSFVIEFNNVGK